MNERQQSLLNQIKHRIGAMVPVSLISPLIAEVRAEALSEVRALLKDVMVEELLAQVLATLPSDPASSSPQSEEDSDDPLHQEIVRLQQQIAAYTVRPAAAPPAAATVVTTPLAAATVVTAPLADPGTGYYVYGIIPHDPAQPALDLPQVSIAPDCPVTTIGYQAIQALVSPVPLAEFGNGTLEANLNDMAWLEARVRAHQEVLATVQTHHTLIPLRFGTIYQSEQRVAAMLAQRYNEFVDTLEWLTDKQEWGVKLYCDDALATEHIANASASVQGLKARMARSSEGAAYLLKKQLDQNSADELERLSDACANHSHEQLAQHAAAAVINPLQRRELSGRSATMILNSAYLVSNASLDSFRYELEQLCSSYGPQGFSYELTGPWPSYNFAHMAPSMEPSHA